MSSMSSENLQITLPNGDVLQMEPGSTAGDVAVAIGPGLAKAAIDPKALPVLRHSAAHVIATAVREIQPGAAIGFGPAIDNGFYYDFDVEVPFTPEDLEVFETKMSEIVAEDQMFKRRRVNKEEARQLFSDDPLKLERLEEFHDDEVITVYENGPFLDLCKGPHVPSTGHLRGRGGGHAVLAS